MIVLHVEMMDSFSLLFVRTLSNYYLLTAVYGSDTLSLICILNLLFDSRFCMHTPCWQKVNCADATTIDDLNCLYPSTVCSSDTQFLQE